MTNEAVLNPASRPVLARAFSVVRSSWRGLTAQHFRLALLAGLLFGSLRVAGIAPRWTEESWWSLAPELIPPMVLALILLLCLTVAANVATTNTPRWAPFVVAAVLATVLAATITLCLAYLVANVTGSSSPVTSSKLLDYVWVGFPVELLAAILAALGYMHWLDATRRSAVLRTLQLERTRIARQAYETRLQALQARVEPRFLFDTLADTEMLYESDPGAGQRMLDDLIAYLRAALPTLDEPSSLLVTELQLVRAWLDIARMRSGDRISYSISNSDTTMDARIPPMVLLPLVQLVVGSQASTAKGDRAIELSINGDDSHLRFIVTARDDAWKEANTEPAMSRIRERLHALYEGRASLTIRSGDAGQSQALLEIPNVPTERHHR